MKRKLIIFLVTPVVCGDEEERVRRKLAFFFMDPVKKFIARRQVGSLCISQIQFNNMSNLKTLLIHTLFADHVRVSKLIVKQL